MDLGYILRHHPQRSTSDAHGNLICQMLYSNQLKHETSWWWTIPVPFFWDGEWKRDPELKIFKGWKQWPPKWLKKLSPELNHLACVLSKTEYSWGTWSTGQGDDQPIYQFVDVLVNFLPPICDKQTSNKLKWRIFIWLVVSTPLKNISQIENLPQIGVKIKDIWNHHLGVFMGNLSTGQGDDRPICGCWLRKKSPHLW